MRRDSRTPPAAIRSGRPARLAMAVAALAVAGAVLVAFAGNSSATVLEQTSEDDKALKRCVQLQKLGELPAKKIDHLKNDGDARVWRIQGQSAEFIAFIMGSGARAACQVYKTTKYAAKLTTVLLPNKGSVEALVIHGEVCNDDDGCAAALVYRERGGAILGAMRTDGCTRGEKLQKIRLFPGNQRSLLRTCRHGHGKHEYEEVQQIIHHDGTKASVIGEFDLGHSRVERKPKGKKTVQICVFPAPGAVKSAGWGPAPKIKVRLPGDESGKSVEEAVWTWDIKATEFVQGKPTVKKIRLDPKCHVEKAAPAKKAKR